MNKLLLEEGLAQLGIDCEPDTKQQLLDFVELLIKWNRVYNLTSVTDPKQIIIRHLFDSLVLVSYFKKHLLSSVSPAKNRQFAPRIIDIGCGAGLPGLPLAMIFPQCDFVLLDSNAKKTRFIVQAVSELGLKNITIQTSRAQDFQPEHRFDCIISRALTSLSDMVTISSHLCAEEGFFLLMKGIFPTQELETIADGVIVRFVESVDVPQLDAQRHIVCLAGSNS